jgi:hypothetical protein
MMTKQEFERAYAARSGLTVEWFHAHGYEARPCGCGEPECRGWRMAHLTEEAWIAPPWESRPLPP